MENLEIIGYKTKEQSRMENLEIIEYKTKEQSRMENLEIIGLTLASFDIRHMTQKTYNTED
jgi:hypothetical protein